MGGVLFFRHLLQIPRRTHALIGVDVDGLAVDALPVRSTLIIGHGVKERLAESNLGVERFRLVRVRRSGRAMPSAMSMVATMRTPVRIIMVAVSVSRRATGSMVILQPETRASRPRTVGILVVAVIVGAL
jgi:hypothetical protein